MKKAPSSRTVTDYLAIYGKGMLMGAADIVPGVSGGTIALILGIYDELITALHNLHPNLWTLWRQQGIKSVWHRINGTFLCTLLGGILTSVLTLAGLIRHWMTNDPIILWSFFFGLIAASCWIILRSLPKHTLFSGLYFILGAVITWQLVLLTPVALQPTQTILFASGMLAICAMILPGISGAFILLLLGVYGAALHAVEQRHMAELACLAGGAVCGLLLFSRLLYWLLHTHRNNVLSLLAGLMAGSLYKVWPWKQLQAAESGIQVWVNVWPWNLAQTTQAAWFLSIMLMFIGFSLVWFTEYKSQRMVL